METKHLPVMKKWTIGKRVTLGFAVVIGILATMAITSYTLLKKIEAHQHGIIGDALPGITDAGQIKYLACDVELNFLRICYSKAAESKPFIDQLAADRSQIQKILEEDEKTIVRPEERKQFEALQTSRTAYLKILDKALALGISDHDAEALQMIPAVRSAYDGYMKECDGLYEENANYGAAAAASSEQAKSSAIALTITLAAIGITFGIILSFSIVRKITAVLLGVSSSINDGSVQVASAAAQVSSASQTLAQGTSEQAASLEETSASLEEVATMSRRNADQAEQCKTWMVEAR